MRQKFEAEDPDVINKAGEEVDRSQGAAKAITVRAVHTHRTASQPDTCCGGRASSIPASSGMIFHGSRASRKVHVPMRFAAVGLCLPVCSAARRPQFTRSLLSTRRTILWQKNAS